MVAYILTYRTQKGLNHETLYLSKSRNALCHLDDIGNGSDDCRKTAECPGYHSLRAELPAATPILRFTMS